MKKWLLLVGLFMSLISSAQVMPKNYDVLLKAVEPELIGWRHHFHENPELSNREFKTGAFIAEQMKTLGLEVRYPVANTGVVAILKGGKPGPVLALRADIDALPLTERTAVPFASKVTTEFNGRTVGVMHACGHDAHTSILMATAKVMKQMQKDLPGTIVFLFQPAEEGAPNKEEAGAPLMIKQGALNDPKVEATFGLHMAAGLPSGQLAYKSGAFQASSDLFKITVMGKGSHGAMPWSSIDPIVVSAQIIEGLQHIVSREADLTKAPLVITVGQFHAGVRDNIIPEKAELGGTIRSLDADMRKKVHERIRKTVTSIAESAGATAEVEINTQTLVNYNDPELAKKSAALLLKAVGSDQVVESTWVMVAEDFSFYGEKAPSFFFSLGGMPKGQAASGFGQHHTPDFYLDESSFITGVKAFCSLVFGYSGVK
jgi:amidohydrolase